MLNSPTYNLVNAIRDTAIRNIANDESSRCYLVTKSLLDNTIRYLNVTVQLEDGDVTADIILKDDIETQTEMFAVRAVHGNRKSFDRLSEEDKTYVMELLTDRSNTLVHRITRSLLTVD